MRKTDLDNHAAGAGLGMVECSVLVFCSVVLALLLSPLLSSQVFSEWDLLPQYYLTERLARQLMHGELSSYDSLWFAGYPTFTYYGWFPYLAALVPHLLFQSLSISASLNLTLFALPFVFLVVLRWTGAAFLRVERRWLILVGGLSMLTLQADSHLVPFGIFSHLLHGHLASFIGTILICALVGTLERARVNNRRSLWTFSGLLFGLILLSHTLSAIFAVFVLCAFLLSAPKTFFWLAGAGLLGLLVGAPSWIPLIQGFDLTSARPVALMGAEPLFVLFPITRFIAACSNPFSPAVLQVAPVFGVFGAIFCVWGTIVSIRRERIFLPVIFWGGLTLISGSWLIQMLHTPLHYGRFVMPLFVIQILLTAIGLEDSLIRLQGRIGFAARVSRSLIGVGLGWQLYSAAVLPYPEKWFPAWLSAPYKEVIAACPALPMPEQIRPIDEYPGYRDAAAVLTFLSQHPPGGRIAVETSEMDYFSLGSPHFFSTLIPLQLGLPVIPGLLAESSYSASFQIPLLTYDSLSLRWGRDGFGTLFREGEAGADTFLSGLRLYGVDVAITSSKPWRELFESKLGNEVSKQFESGEFAVFKLANSPPYVEHAKYKPFLFIERGGMSFREFSERWFEISALRDVPVVFSTRDFTQLGREDQAAIGGFVLSFPEGAEPQIGELEGYANQGKSVLVLNGKAAVPLPENARQIRFGDSTDRDSLVRALTDLRRPDELAAEVSNLSHSDHEISFEAHGGTIIRFSYFPRWKSRTGDQQVFLVAPSLMYIAARGRTELRYE